MTESNAIGLPLELSSNEIQDIIVTSQEVQDDIVQHPDADHGNTGPYPKGTLLCIEDGIYQVVNWTAGVTHVVESGQAAQQVVKLVDDVDIDNSILSSDDRIIGYKPGDVEDPADQLQLANRNVEPSDQQYLSVLSEGGVYTGAVISEDALGSIEASHVELTQQETENSLPCSSNMTPTMPTVAPIISNTQLDPSNISVHIGLAEDVNLSPKPHMKNKKPKKSRGRPQLMQCELCSATFNRVSNYNRHKLVHAIDVKAEFHYQCEVCGQQFLQHCDLRRHMQIHTDTQPHACTICDKKYVRQSDLRNHMRFHNNDRAFPCEHCDKAFCQKGDLSRHVRRVHLKSKMVTCGHCHRRYASEATLIRHMQTTHRELLLEALPGMSTVTTCDPVVPIESMSPDDKQQHVLIRHAPVDGAAKGGIEWAIFKYNAGNDKSADINKPSGS